MSQKLSFDLNTREQHCFQLCYFFFLQTCQFTVLIFSLNLSGINLTDHKKNRIYVQRKYKVLLLWLRKTLLR